MIRITFSAERNLTGLHVAGDLVTLSLSAIDGGLVPGRKVTRDTQRSLSGRRETLLHNDVRTWQITTVVERVDLDELEEFLASAEDGQTFTFEPWWYANAPALDLDFTTPRLRIAEVINACLDSESYSLSRLVGEGTGGADDVYQVSFTVEESP